MESDPANEPAASVEAAATVEPATSAERAAVEAARSLDFTFTLAARAENFIVGRPDLQDTIKRLQAFQDAGADVLFAPGLTSREDIETVVRSIDRPLNVIMGLQGVQLTLDDLSSIGVRRISVGSALSRARCGGSRRRSSQPWSLIPAAFGLPA